MTKKKVEVDEDILKDIIVGEIPVFGREMPAEESTGQPEPEAPPATEPAGHPPGVAVRAAVLAAGNRVPGAVAPFDAGLVHLPLTPSRSRQLFTQDGMG